ncbi:MAG: ABC transporter permease [Thermomicrobiales bacterium]
MSSARPPATASRAPRQSPLLGGYFALLVILLYLPICILVLFSLNQNTVLIFPLEGFTLDWYQKALDTPAAIDAARNSLVVALGSSVVATILATMLAILITRYSFRGKQVLLAAASLPLIVPYIVLAVALLILFSLLGVDRSLLTVAAAHSVVALPYALLIIVSRLTGLSPFLDEASADLGADYPTTLRRVVLPIIAPAVAAAWLVAFTASFDEFALALFLAGPEPTLPVFIYGQLRFASRFPMLIALAVLVMAGTLTLAFLADRLRKRV